MPRRLARALLVVVALGAIVLGLSGGWRDGWVWGWVAAIAVCTGYAVASVTLDLARERVRAPSGGADARALIAIRLLGSGHLAVAAVDAGR